MREITFRGKTYDGMWIEGAYYHANKNYGDPDDMHCIISTTESLDYEQALEYFPVDPSTVGQYTGLKDKNGKRIFEGDVVSYKRVHQFTEDDDIEDYGNQFPDKISDCLGVVEFRNGKFMPLPERHDCDDYWYSDGQYGFEVIGNIHDNPELMEVR